MKRILVILLVGLLISTTINVRSNEPHKINPVVYAKGKAKKTKKRHIGAYKSLGKYTLTAYCGCPYCSGNWGNRTSTGKIAKPNHTIAVDPSVIPYGSKIKIGKTVYTAEDCGGGIKGKHIDIFFSNHKDALRFGRRKQKIYIRRK